jgi:branched-chain amino acid transport system substrate-binding protein
MLMSTLQKKNIALLYQNDIYGNGLKDQFETKLKALGGTVAAEQAFQIGQTSFSAQVNMIMAASPDAVFVPGFYKELSLGIKELRSQGFTGIIVASEAIENQDIFQIGGSSLKDILFMKATVESTRATYAKFLTNYSAKYGGAKPGAYADYGYDALLTIVETLRAKGVDATSTQIKDYMHQTTFTTTVTRDIKFDGNGDLIGGSYVLYKIQCSDASCSSGDFIPY